MDIVCFNTCIYHVISIEKNDILRPQTDSSSKMYLQFLQILYAKIEQKENGD